MANVLILEGIDKAGKTSVVEILKKTLGNASEAPVIKGLPAKTLPDFAKANYEILSKTKAYLAQNKNVIIDRINLISDFVYNPKLDSEVTDMEYLKRHAKLVKQYARMLRNISENHQVFIVFITATPDTILKRMELDGGPEDSNEVRVKENVTLFLQKYESLFTTIAGGIEPIFNNIFAEIAIVDSTTLISTAIAESIENMMNNKKDVRAQTLNEIIENINTRKIRGTPLKVASIVPKSYDPISNFSLLLTHLIENNEDEIKKWRHYEGYKILDNSAFELGTSVPLENVLKVAEQIDANEIVLPDVFGNFEATIQKTNEALEQLRKYRSEGKYNHLKCMAVPQGATIEEFEKCIERFNKIPEIDVIAINRDSAKFLGNRLYLLEQLRNKGLLKVHKEYHLLGMADNILEIKYVHERFPEVRSMDSSFPYLLAKQFAENNIDATLILHPKGFDRSSFEKSINFNEGFNNTIYSTLMNMRVHIQNKWGIDI